MHVLFMKMKNNKTKNSFYIYIYIYTHTHTHTHTWWDCIKMKAWDGHKILDAGYLSREAGEGIWGGHEVDDKVLASAFFGRVASMCLLIILFLKEKSKRLVTHRMLMRGFRGPMVINNLILCTWVLFRKGKTSAIKHLFLDMVRF